MNEKLENVKKILSEYNQEEILDTLECLDENEKEKIFIIHAIFMLIIK